MDFGSSSGLGFVYLIRASNLSIHISLHVSYFNAKFSPAERLHEDHQRGANTYFYQHVDLLYDQSNSLTAVAPSMKKLVTHS